MPSPMRRFGLYGLILLALTLVSIVVFVIVTDESVSAEDDIFPSPVNVDPEQSTKIEITE